MKYTHIIWDFNGTIINDLPLSFSSINTVLEKRNLKKLSTYDEYREKFCFPIKKYYEDIGLDFTKEPYKIPADEWVKLYNNGIYTVPLSENIIYTLDKIKEMGIPQIILSASDITMLKNQLDFYKITDYFNLILGCDNVYGKGKIELAKKWASECDINFKNTLYIGDTDHDYETARELGSDCVLYCGGHMSRRQLERLCTPIIDKIDDILNLI